MHVPSVALRLWVDLRVSVHLRRGCEEEARALPFRETEASEGAEGPHLQGLDRVREVVDGRCRGREIEDPVDRALDAEALRDVDLLDREAALGRGIAEVLPRSRQEGIDADDLPAFVEEPVAEMRADEAGPACDDGPRSGHVPGCSTGRCSTDALAVGSTAGRPVG